jgi:2-keto-4-pentenoate hydratase/2-oxohepta-3-ene-1,7-dioic acid hydratase in catechol pathway
VVGDEVELLDADLLPTGRRSKAAGLRFKTPVDPVKIWCVGLNYREHAKEAKMEIPDEPCVFMKPTTCLIAHGEAIKIPDHDKLGRVDYEGELAVVMGLNCRNVGEHEALDYVLGYSCFNDVSARALQKRDGQWVRAKGFDTFGPFGPVLLLQKNISPETRIKTRLNGTVVQDAGFSDMIFSVSSIISHTSRFATLEAGDVIITGTPSGVGAVKHGDVVEIEIEGLGTLRNPVDADGRHA